jgi:hypothetical protein
LIRWLQRTKIICKNIVRPVKNTCFFVHFHQHINMTTLESDPVAMDESTDDNDSIVESEEHSSQTETEDDSDDSSEEEEESKSIVTTIPKRISMQPSTIVTEQDKIEFLKRLEVTEEQIEHIRCIDQRTPEWKEARKDRLTGSNFGAAANLSPY